MQVDVSVCQFHGLAAGGPEADLRRTWAGLRRTWAGPEADLDTQTRSASDTVAGAMPRIWIYTQLAIVVFVCIGIVIAITKLA
ncbi:MAG: hypothetical protein ACLP0J_14915 [Solirubrobacteraceae bacterium]